MSEIFQQSAEDRQRHPKGLTPCRAVFHEKRHVFHGKFTIFADVLLLNQPNQQSANRLTHQ